MSWDRVERLIGSDNLSLLATKHVGVVGLGSGGGFVALSLAMSGVKRFTLIDPDTLELTNIVRHVSDRRDIGKAKTEAVAELIRQRNPDAEITQYIGRIEERLDLLDNLDLLIVGVDGEGAKYIMNQACLERGLTAVYAGVYERGEGGDVVVIHPADGPCYACWAAELREGLSFTHTDQGELDYGMIGETGTLEAEPGLWLHVVRVASTQADRALNELLSGTTVYKKPPTNTVILANTELEIIDGQTSLPYTAVWVQIDRDPECLVCGNLMRQHEALAQSDEDSVSLDDLMNTAGMMLEDGENEERHD